MLKRELPRILGTRRRIILFVVVGVFGVGALLLMQLLVDRPFDVVRLLISMLAAIGSACFGSIGPLVLWIVFDKGWAPSVAFRDETLIEKIVDPDDNASLESTDTAALQNVVANRFMLLPTSIATQIALAGTGCFLVPAGILMGVESYSLIAFPFLVLASTLTLPSQLAALGRAEMIANAVLRTDGP